MLLFVIVVEIVLSEVENEVRRRRGSGVWRLDLMVIESIAPW